MTKTSVVEAPAASRAPNQNQSQEQDLSKVTVDHKSLGITRDTPAADRNESKTAAPEIKSSALDLGARLRETHERHRHDNTEQLAQQNGMQAMRMASTATTLRDHHRESMLEDGQNLVTTSKKKKSAIADLDEILRVFPQLQGYEEQVRQAFEQYRKATDSAKNSSPLEAQATLRNAIDRIADKLKNDLPTVLRMGDVSIDDKAKILDAIEGRLIEVIEEEAQGLALSDDVKGSIYESLWQVVLNAKLLLLNNRRTVELPKTVEVAPILQAAQRSAQEERKQVIQKIDEFILRKDKLDLTDNEKMILAIEEYVRGLKDHKTELADLLKEYREQNGQDLMSLVDARCMPFAAEQIRYLLNYDLLGFDLAREQHASADSESARSKENELAEQAAKERQEIARLQAELEAIARRQAMVAVDIREGELDQSRQDEIDSDKTALQAQIDARFSSNQMLLGYFEECFRREQEREEIRIVSQRIFTAERNAACWQNEKRGNESAQRLSATLSAHAEFILARNGLTELLNEHRSYAKAEGEAVRASIEQRMLDMDEALDDWIGIDDKYFEKALTGMNQYESDAFKHLFNLRTGKNLNDVVRKAASSIWSSAYLEKSLALLDGAPDQSIRGIRMDSLRLDLVQGAHVSNTLDCVNQLRSRNKEEAFIRLAVIMDGLTPEQREQLNLAVDAVTGKSLAMHLAAQRTGADDKTSNRISFLISEIPGTQLELELIAFEDLVEKASDPLQTYSRWAHFKTSEELFALMVRYQDIHGRTLLERMAGRDQELKLGGKPGSVGFTSSLKLEGLDQIQSFNLLRKLAHDQLDAREKEALNTGNELRLAAFDLRHALESEDPIGLVTALCGGADPKTLTPLMDEYKKLFDEDFKDPYQVQFERIAQEKAKEREKALKYANSYGRQARIDEAQRDQSSTGLSGAMFTLSSAYDAQNLGIESNENERSRLMLHARRIDSDQEEASKLFTQYQDLAEKARESLAAGKQEEGEKLAQQAHARYVESLQQLARHELVLVSENARQSMAQRMELYGRAEEQFNTWERRLKAVRTGSYMIGAAWTGQYWYFAVAGTAAIALTSSAVEQGGNVAYGNKTWGQAGKDFAKDSSRELLSIAVTRGAVVLGSAAGGAVTGAMGNAATRAAQYGSIGRVSASAIRLAGPVAGGMAGGGAAGVGQDVIIQGQEYLYGDNKEHNYNPTFGERIQRVLQSGGIGAVTGGMGASAQMARSATNSSTLRGAISFAEYTGAGAVGAAMGGGDLADRIIGGAQGIVGAKVGNEAYARHQAAGPGSTGQMGFREQLRHQFNPQTIRQNFRAELSNSFVLRPSGEYGPLGFPAPVAVKPKGGGPAPEGPVASTNTSKVPKAQTPESLAALSPEARAAAERIATLKNQKVEGMGSAKNGHGSDGAKLTKTEAKALDAEIRRLERGYERDITAAKDLNKLLEKAGESEQARQLATDLARARRELADLKGAEANPKRGEIKQLEAKLRRELALESTTNGKLKGLDETGKAEKRAAAREAAEKAEQMRTAKPEERTAIKERLNAINEELAVARRDTRVREAAKTQTGDGPAGRAMAEQIVAQTRRASDPSIPEPQRVAATERVRSMKDAAKTVKSIDAMVAKVDPKERPGFTASAIENVRHITQGGAASVQAKAKNVKLLEQVQAEAKTYAEYQLGLLKAADSAKAVRSVEHRYEAARKLLDQRLKGEARAKVEAEVKHLDSVIKKQLKVAAKMRSVPETIAKKLAAIHPEDHPRLKVLLERVAQAKVRGRADTAEIKAAKKTIKEAIADHKFATKQGYRSSDYAKKYVDEFSITKAKIRRLESIVENLKASKRRDSQRLENAEKKLFTLKDRAEKLPSLIKRAQKVERKYGPGTDPAKRTELEKLADTIVERNGNVSRAKGMLRGNRYDYAQLNKMLNRIGVGEVTADLARAYYEKCWAHRVQTGKGRWSALQSPEIVLAKEMYHRSRRGENARWRSWRLSGTDNRADGEGYVSRRNEMVATFKEIVEAQAKLALLKGEIDARMSGNLDSGKLSTVAGERAQIAMLEAQIKTDTARLKLNRQAFKELNKSFKKGDDFIGKLAEDLYQARMNGDKTRIEHLSADISTATSALRAAKISGLIGGRLTKHQARMAYEKVQEQIGLIQERRGYEQRMARATHGSEQAQIYREIGRVNAKINEAAQQARALRGSLMRCRIADIQYTPFTDPARISQIGKIALRLTEPTLSNAERAALRGELAFERKVYKDYKWAKKVSRKSEQGKELADEYYSELRRERELSKLAPRRGVTENPELIACRAKIADLKERLPRQHKLEKAGRNHAERVEMHLKNTDPTKETQLRKDAERLERLRENLKAGVGAENKRAQRTEMDRLYKKFTIERQRYAALIRAAEAGWTTAVTRAMGRSAVPFGQEIVLSGSSGAASVASRPNASPRNGVSTSSEIESMMPRMDIDGFEIDRVLFDQLTPDQQSFVLSKMTETVRWARLAYNADVTAGRTKLSFDEWLGMTSSSMTKAGKERALDSDLPELEGEAGANILAGPRLGDGPRLLSAAAKPEVSPESSVRHLGNRRLLDASRHRISRGRDSDLPRFDADDPGFGFNGDDFNSGFDSGFGSGGGNVKPWTPPSRGGGGAAVMEPRATARSGIRATVEVEPISGWRETVAKLKEIGDQSIPEISRMRVPTKSDIRFVETLRSDIGPSIDERVAAGRMNYRRNSIFTEEPVMRPSFVEQPQARPTAVATETPFKLNFDFETVPVQQRELAVMSQTKNLTMTNTDTALAAKTGTKTTALAKTTVENAVITAGKTKTASSVKHDLGSALALSRQPQLDPQKDPKRAAPTKQMVRDLDEENRRRRRSSSGASSSDADVPGKKLEEEAIIRQNKQREEERRRAKTPKGRRRLRLKTEDVGGKSEQRDDGYQVTEVDQFDNKET